MTSHADVARVGGTMVQVLDDIIGRGALPSMIRIVTVVCTPVALKKLSEGYPGALPVLPSIVPSGFKSTMATPLSSRY